MANVALNTADSSAHGTVRKYVHGYSPGLAGTAFVTSYLTASTKEAHLLGRSPFHGVALLHLK
jgi:hypothetical protein